LLSLILESELQKTEELSTTTDLQIVAEYLNVSRWFNLLKDLLGLVIDSELLGIRQDECLPYCMMTETSKGLETPRIPTNLFPSKDYR